MDGDVANKVIEMLEKLGTTLSELAPDAYKIAVQSVYVSVIQDVALLLLVVTTGCILIFSGRWVYKYGGANNTRSDMSDSEFVGLLTVFAGLLLQVFDILIVGRIVAQLVAVDYFAVKNVIELVTGG